MRFETEDDLIRERRAIETYVNVFGGSFKKLGPDDIDYKVFNKDGKLVAYAEVKGRHRYIRDAYPLPISVNKISKLQMKMLNPLVIWACDDGIIFGRPEDISGIIKMGGRKPRDGSANDNELMAYYEKQRGLKYVRYKKEPDYSE